MQTALLVLLLLFATLQKKKKKENARDATCRSRKQKTIFTKWRRKANMDTLKYRKFEQQLEKFSNIEFFFFFCIYFSPPHVLCFSCVHQRAFLNFCSERSTSIGKWTGSWDELGWPLLRRGLQLNVEPWMGSVALLSGAFYFKCVTVSCAGAFHYFCRSGQV